MSVSETLTRMEELSSRIGGEGAAADANATIGLRQEFGTECGNLLKAYCDDPSIFDNRILFTELQDGLETVRTRMSNHQLKWQGESIAQNPEAYRKASRSIHEAVVQYIADARAKTGR